MKSNQPLSGLESVFSLGVAALVVWAGITGVLKITFFWGAVIVLAIVVLRAAWGLARLLLG